MRGSFVGSALWMCTVPRDKGCSRQMKRERRFLPSGGFAKNFVWSEPAETSSIAGKQKVWRLAKVGSESCLIIVFVLISEHALSTSR